MNHGRTRGAALLLSIAAGAAAAQDQPAVDAASVPAAAEVPAATPAEAAPASEASPAVAAVAPVEADPAAQANAGSSNRLVEEIVVTAQKREERLQDVPISIQAFSQEKLEVLGIQSVQDVQRATPGFTVTNAASFNVVFLRGVGSDAYLPGVDSSVPFYLDGVPLLNAQGTSDTLGRVSRIEVLKGPQGTLFGRNATGGTISIVTPDPGQTFEGDGKVEIGNYGTLNASAYSNIPVLDNLAFNISAYSNDRNNIIKNESTGQLPDHIFGRGFRVKAKWDVVDDLALTLAGSFNETQNNGGIAFQNVRPAPALAGGGLILPADSTGFDRRVELDGDAGAAGKGYMLSGVVDWHLTPIDTKFIYAHQRIEPTQVDGPFDGTKRPVVDAHGAGYNGERRVAHQFVRQDSAELQFLSNQDTPGSDLVEWVGGFFYLDSLGGFDPIVFNVAPSFFTQILPSFDAALPGTSALFGTFTDVINGVLGGLGLPPITGQEGLQLANYGLIDARTLSGYAQATWHVLEEVDLTTGVRYQDEKRKLVDSHTSFLLEDGSEVLIPLPQGGKETLHAKQTSARVALQWRPFGREDQFYTSWARAFKSPTYNTVNVTGNLFGTMVPLKEERVDTFELGTKLLLLDGNLQLNAAAFYTKQKDPLSANVSIPSGGIANFTNAGAARIRGADGDFLLIPLPVLDSGLVITGGVSYLDAIYTSFENGRGYDDATGLGFGNGGASLPARDLSGKRIPRVPEWSWTLGVSQRFDFSDSSAIEIGADTFYTSKIYFLPQNSELSKRDPLHLYNARITYIYEPWQTEITAFCNNIADKTYVDSAFVTDFGTALLANEDPRLYGLRVKVSF